MPKAGFDHHISHQPYSLHMQQGLAGHCLVGSFTRCVRKLIIHIVQEPPRQPPLHCAEFLADIQEAEVFHKTKE